MPVGLIIMKWDERIGTEILAKYPEELIISDKTLMQVYSTHEYTGEPGMISLMVGHLNIVSFYTGRERALYVVSILALDDDPDVYEEGLSDISRILIQNFEDNKYLDMLPFLFQRLSVYPNLNIEQSLAIKYQDEVNRLIINRLREEGVISKSELKVWLKDKYRRGFFDLDAMLSELIKKELIKEASVKGIPSELIFYINDLFMIRRPPIKILQSLEGSGLPERFLNEYRTEVRKFFQNYHISEKDNLNLIEVLTDPQIYEILKLLRLKVVTRNDLEKLRKKGVDDIDYCLNKLWEHQLIHVIQGDNGVEYYCLLNDFSISKIYPKFILSTILKQYDVKSKSEAVLIEYLNVLEENYPRKKLKEDLI